MYVNIPYVCTLHGRCEHIWSQIDGGKEGYAPVISLLYMCVWTRIVQGVFFTVTHLKSSKYKQVNLG